MKLHDAFTTLQPIPVRASTLECLRLQEAARLLLAALNEQARLHMPRSRYSSSDRDTAVQTVMFRVLKSGPRGPRAGDPGDGDGVKRWLGRAIRNAAIDQHRKRRHLVVAGSALLDRCAHLDHGHESGGTHRVTQRRLNDALAKARAYLFDHIVAAVARRKRSSSVSAAERFLVNVAVLRGAVREGKNVMVVARESLVADGKVMDAEPFATRMANARRGALDKRFQRVRQHIIDEIERQGRAAVIDKRMRAALLLLVQETLYLQRRADAVIQRAHRDTPSGSV